MNWIEHPEVAAVFDAYPPRLRDRLLALRALILETAAATEGVGEIEEALRWGEPSYLTRRPKSGTTVRVGPVRGRDDQYAMYVHCQTNLLETFRERYPDELNFLGDRGVVFDVDAAIPTEQVAECIALALRYHADKKRSATA
jgi:hypothetical protein